MYCGNTNFIYHEEFSKYMKRDGGMLEDIFGFSLIWEPKIFLPKEGKKYLYELFEK